ncbi:MAG TPA: hypothetical protein VGW38_27825, partial [Chloroflexota bacterium]|nr:hypothetical protein [Chloroflexota bacterium]
MAERRFTRFLMGRPDGFTVRYEINPWMHVGSDVDHIKAHTQWQDLCQTYRDLGAKVELLEPSAEQPDLVYVANAGLVQGNRVLLSRFRHAERQGEEAIFRCWFEARGYEIVRPPSG